MRRRPDVLLGGIGDTARKCRFNPEVTNAKYLLDDTAPEGAKLASVFRISSLDSPASKHDVVTVSG